MAPQAKKAGKKKPKKFIEKLTPNELFLDYKIGVSRSTLMELEQKKFKLLEMIELKEGEMRELSAKGNSQMKETLEKWNEFKAAEPKETSSEKVIKYMHSNWKLKEIEQERILAIEGQIRRIKENIKHTKDQIKHWNHFESNIMPSNNEFINLLRQEITSMNERYESLTKNIEKSFIEKETSCLDNLQSKMQALQEASIDNALMKLDKQHFLDVRQQDWLKKELSLLKSRENELQRHIKFLEVANVDLCAGLEQTIPTSLSLSEQFPDHCIGKAIALHCSHILDLDLKSHFDELDLKASQSVVDELTPRELDEILKYGMLESAVVP